MNEKAASTVQKALQERKRGQHTKAIKRLEQALAAFPDELDLYLETVDACLEGGEVMQATQILKTAQDRFATSRDRLHVFVRDKLASVHDPSLARFAVESAVKRRDLVAALEHLFQVPDHTVRDLHTRMKTKKQSLKSANHGGYSLRGELLTNELTSALVSIRLGNMKEATATLLEILDEKPVEHKMLVPFLASLEAQHPKSGRVRFAHACALWASGSEAEAVLRFVDASRIEPAVAAVCAERMKLLRDTARARAKFERAFAEVVLVKGDFDEAATILSHYLEANPDNSREVIMLLRPYIEPANGVNACTWVALNASMTLDQSSVALELLRPLQQRGGASAEILEWLDARNGTGTTPELTMFHAGAALEAKRFAHAASLLESVCTSSPQDTHAVLALIERHRSADPALEALHGKYARGEDPAETEAVAEDTEFQLFENNEFRLEQSQPRPRPAEKKAPEPDGEKPASRFADATRPRTPARAFVDSAELSFDDDAPSATAAPESPETPDEAPSLRTDDAPDPGFETARPAFAATPASAPRPKPAPTPAPAPRAAPASTPATKPPVIVITEAHVANVAHQLYRTGAAAFFHIDASDTDEPAPAPQTPNAAEPAPRAPEPPATFASDFERFRRGELDNARILELIQRGLDENRTGDVRELLTFEAAGEEENFARRYFGAELLFLEDRPLHAIDALRSLDRPALTPGQKRRIWLKLATCQRATNDFAGANDTLTRLVDAFPADDEIARLARVNYEQYLNAQCSEAAVLEKTTSLD